VVGVDSTASHQPALTRWQSTWRYLFAILSGLAIWVGSLYGEYAGASGVLPAIDLLLGLVSVVLMR
jgi:hypothetical protein